MNFHMSTLINFLDLSERISFCVRTGDAINVLLRNKKDIIILECECFPSSSNLTVKGWMDTTVETTSKDIPRTNVIVITFIAFASSFR